MSKISSFIAEVRQIFKEITWPKRDTLIQLTVVVISISIVVALILGGFDYLFTNTVGILTSLPNNQTPEVELGQPTGEPTIVVVSPTASASPSLKPTLKPKTIKK